MRRSSFFLFVFYIISLLYAPTCFAAEPLSIAILPVINQTNTHDEAVENVILEALHAKFRTSLSSIVPIYQLIPDNDVSTALPPDIHKRPYSLKFEPTMLKDVANRLHADIVIGAVITNLRELTFTSWTGDPIQQTNLSIRLVVYKTSEQEYIDIHDYKDYVGERMTFSDADYLAKIIMDRLMSDLTFRDQFLIITGKD